jgi:glycerol kinase
VPLLLAIDLGTTSTRALAIEAGHAVRGRAQLPLTTRCPRPGFVEQDPEQMFERSVEVAREALARAGAAAADVAALGIVTQRATVIAWDADTGKSLCPAVGWQDQRTHARAAELQAAGIPISTLPSATKLEWLLKRDAAVAAAARAGRLRFGTPDAWLGFRLSGGASFATDPGQASCTALFDLERGAWSEPLLGMFGVAAETLPALAPTSGVEAEVQAEHLGRAIPIAARAGDQQAACFAQGAHAKGDAKLTLGTSAMLDVNTGGAVQRAPHGAYPLALWRLRGEPTAFGLEGSVITAGAAIDWLVDARLLASPAALDAVARSVASAEGVAFVPALQGLGTPFMDPDARGFVGGLTRGSTAAHVVRAALEGIAHRCADVCEALFPSGDRLRVDGGLARCGFLVQRIADLSGRRVERAFETEATAIGAAWLAAHGAGILVRPADALAWLPPREPFLPEDPPEARHHARERWRAVLRRVGGPVPSLR